MFNGSTVIYSNENLIYNFNVSNLTGFRNKFELDMEYGWSLNGKNFQSIVPVTWDEDKFLGNYIYLSNYINTEIYFNIYDIKTKQFTYY